MASKFKINLIIFTILYCREIFLKIDIFSEKIKSIYYYKYPNKSDF